MSNSEPQEEEVFKCQSTSLIEATSSLPLWDFRQYLWDISSGNFKPIDRLHMLLINLRVKAESLLIGKKYVLIRGRCRSTPIVTLNLQAGEIVEVKTKEEIVATLDSKGRNRGLDFKPEMSKYCGKKFRVLKRLDRMMNERTGKIRLIKNTVLLEGVTCDGKMHSGCQRNCFCLWREAWLRRVPPK